MLATPTFDSAFPGAVFDAVQGRRKAIRYHGTLECSRDVEQGSERLNVDVAATDSVRLHLSIWPDGAFWLAVTKPGPSRTGGWQIHEEIEGRWPSFRRRRSSRALNSPTDAPRIWHTQHI